MVQIFNVIFVQNFWTTTHLQN